MFKTYISHPTIWAYLVLLGMAGSYALEHGLIEKHWPFFILPLFVSPFFEWFVHKYALHRIIDRKNEMVHAYMGVLHYGHHKEPADKVLVFAPVSAGIAVFVIVFVLFSIIGLSFERGFTAMVFSIGYYLYYEWVHLGHHMVGYDHLTPYGRFMKKAHMWHHNMNENYWWGITSHFGDMALKTFPDPKDVPRSSSVKDIEKAKR